MASRGRPAREPTTAERKRVRAFVADGAAQRLIAAALQRSLPNLRKYFAAELGLEKKSAAAAPITITAQMRADVALMAACGEPHERIAKAIGVGSDDLAKYFAEDLESGAARYRLKTLQRLERLAELGSLNAVGKLAALTSPAAADASKKAAPAAGYVGKKATAKADAAAAVAAGGKFAPRPGPRLAVVGGKPVEPA
jgi:hypothetical protein